MRGFNAVSPKESGEYGNAWVLAFAYDLLSTYPSLMDEDRDVIETKLVRALREYLILLNSDGPSLWHGRNTLASIAWIIAITLNPSSEDVRNNIVQAQAHFLDVVRSIQITEAWPGGYNYWIQERAFLFVLAASAYLNGIESSQYADEIKRILEQVGLWHVYAVRPDDRVEGFGDEGSRVDLKDETARVIDLLAQATKNPIFSQFSRYIQRLHGKESYYRGYQWGFQLFNDPSIFSLPQRDKDLSNFSGLSNVGWFGKDAFNMFYLRSGWSDDDTFITYKAGHVFTHHGHYDAGHFTIYKGAPLVVNSSSYKDFTGENRLNYSIRTIAKNSILVQKPGERVKPNRFFKKNVSAGGQRIIIPTGSSINNVQQWKENIRKGKHYEGAQVLKVDAQDNEYVYIKTDLTKAYNNQAFSEDAGEGKVKSIVRSILYLDEEDSLVVFDNISTTQPSYKKKWIMHTENKPQLAQLKTLKGNESNGILESKEGYALIKNANSMLHVNKIYPEKSVFKLVGGKDYKYYVESDGDDSTLDGESFYQGASDKDWFDKANWRLEIEPQQETARSDFFIVLSPRLKDQRPPKVYKVKSQGNVKSAIVNKKLIAFFDREMIAEILMDFPLKINRAMLIGVRPNSLIKYKIGSDSFVVKSNEHGVLSLDFREGGFDIDRLEIGMAQ